MDLFPATDPRPAREALADDAVLLPRFALPWEDAIADALPALLARSPFRNMETPGGHRMSVAMTNCGELGWTTDRRGYRYTHEDPLTGTAWPALPPAWRALARAAAAVAGWPRFEPDACLVNRYLPGARMGLHQDRNERDLAQPVVSASFGLPATFLFGGEARGDRPRRVPLLNGDVVVWGGAARLLFHGIAPLKAGAPTRFGEARVNLTFRRAG